ncbi:MAG: 50S ribosomal protein L18 [Erysipelotrichaceae bacterium]|jgi:large subunit ribosomal protein L18|nr:50S ribosomal protein L18 [Bacillota bacterium]MDY0117988.1 50S ribosomal protein L18 [Bacilli bacterium]NLJ32659.1 50S ribosomal protein L18 [Erysipelotrichaceae bacterium]
MIKQNKRDVVRKRRHLRVRSKISGTPERPRLAIFRSNKHISCQIIDDVVGHTLVSTGSLNLGLEHGGNIEAAKVVGEQIAKLALSKGIKNVVFDRGGFLYHGRVKALAEAAREAGLEF